MMGEPRKNQLSKLTNQIYFSGKDKEKILNAQLFSSLHNTPKSESPEMSHNLKTINLNFFDTMRTPNRVINKLTHKIYNSESRPVPFPLELPFLTGGKHSHTHLHNRLKIDDFRFPSLKIKSPEETSHEKLKKNRRSDSVEKDLLLSATVDSTYKITEKNKEKTLNRISQSCEKLISSNKKSKKRMIKNVKSLSKKMRDCKWFSDLIEKSNDRVGYYVVAKAIRERRN
ncbi:unnamed protein product [Blepharisma stoltei]|uniref:Uncharacterized protein n=1 Tax=Blepharisma stoltei TaxID=1481888 RepID=A0AAU9K5M0_9CILI|nr:unnamed protein product [Blepharisma stoltei]